MLSEELKYPSNFTPEVQNATAELYKGVEKVIPAVEWPFHAPLIHEINKLKKEKNIALPQAPHDLLDVWILHLFEMDNFCNLNHSHFRI